MAYLRAKFLVDLSTRVTGYSKLTQSFNDELWKSRRLPEQTYRYFLDIFARSRPYVKHSRDPQSGLSSINEKRLFIDHVFVATHWTSKNNIRCRVIDQHGLVNRSKPEVLSF